MLNLRNSIRSTTSISTNSAPIKLSSITTCHCPKVHRRARKEYSQ
jgi:hypothetical protein